MTVLKHMTVVTTNRQDASGWWILEAESGDDAVALKEGREVITVEEFGIAERVHDCINACDGLENPARTLAKVRDFLRGLSKGFGHAEAAALLSELGDA